MTEPRTPPAPKKEAPCNGHQRHWFTRHFAPQALCVRCGAPNPKWGRRFDGYLTSRATGGESEGA